MHKIKIAGLLVSLVLCYGGNALAQNLPNLGGPEIRSNSGGALKGLERADQAAGSHGSAGRETARRQGDNRYNEHPSANMGQSQNPGHGMGGGSGSGSSDMGGGGGGHGGDHGGGH